MVTRSSISLASKESIMDKDVLVELVIVVIRVILENIR
jgi:hypothetical protein